MLEGGVLRDLGIVRLKAKADKRGEAHNTLSHSSSTYFSWLLRLLGLLWLLKVLPRLLLECSERALRWLLKRPLVLQLYLLDVLLLAEFTGHLLRKATNLEADTAKS